MGTARRRVNGSRPLNRIGEVHHINKTQLESLARVSNALYPGLPTRSANWHPGIHRCAYFKQQASYGMHREVSARASTWPTRCSCRIHSGGGGSSLL